MTPQDFTYWLQGFVEMTEADTISDVQWKMIKDHLKLTVNKQTPSYPKVMPAPMPQTDLFQPSWDLSKLAITC